ncbi:MAG: hypothetical protein ACTSW1_09785 [Candidatus Hodarchaeales archaeon]
MTKIQQVIVRNIPEKGLDVIATTLIQPNIFDITPFIPEKKTPNFDKVYLSKFQYSTDSVALRFTFDDGTDRYGRPRFKTHTLIIDNSYFNDKSIQYFISPILNGSLNSAEHVLLKDSDFEDINPAQVPASLIELILFKKNLRLTKSENFDPIYLIELFAALDRAIPPILNNRFSFQTMVSPQQKKVIKNCSLIFTREPIPNSIDIDILNDKDSEYDLINDIARSLSDLSLLRKLQRELFLNNSNKKLSLKIRLRFGIRKVSEIKKIIESQYLEY